MKTTSNIFDNKIKIETRKVKEKIIYRKMKKEGRREGYLLIEFACE